HIRAHRPPSKTREARHQRRRRGMTRRPIGLAPNAPTEALGQDAKKYSTRNPIVRGLISRWLRIVRTAVAQPRGILVDVGVGEGLSLKRVLPPGCQPVGVEYRHAKIRVAQQHIEQLPVVVADAGMLPLRGAS